MFLNNSPQFIRVAAACPITNVSDIKFNVSNIKECIDNAVITHSKLVVFPELCITSYTCADLFEQQILITSSIEGIKDLCEYTVNSDILIAVGAPLLWKDCLYNCAFILFKGKVLGIVPKSYIPNYTEFYEKRWFTEGLGLVNKRVSLSFQNDIPFGTNLIFKAGNIKFGFEVCIWYISILFILDRLNIAINNSIKLNTCRRLMCKGGEAYEQIA